ncbi:NAD(P)-dependent alcohol dehydrogenase [Mycobacterium yunnanensis]|uniref:NAD(P)-dependent alcohol dehydrogenase n=1 Tax=Mycobacterium yunnanensis TaxID=368477 RepID=A0A9X2YYW1_9MYCO|nr:NAD(P)-dependent alcohol dehydrogenase [Mycobacterium yunnanensis]MCV7419994.1 NAD(P)-dependent alcohol dehydrogenase [Mycobacterium yunnanensis]
MRAVVVQRPGTTNPLEVVDVPDPGDPQPGEVRVRLHGSSLNFHDGLVIGDPNTAVGHVPLADGGGVVEAVGAGVTDLAEGDAVFAAFTPEWADGAPTRDAFAATPGIGPPGYAQDVVVVPASHFTLAPHGWSAHEAATLTVAGLTAWRSVIVEGRVKPGDVVLVLGTGGVATFAVQFAKMAGATVVTTSSSEAKLERAKALGADHLVNYREVTDWGRHVADLTGGADLVVELGGSGTLPQSIDAARVGAQISLIGVLDGASGAIHTGSLTMKQLRLHGIVVGSRRHQQDMVRALQDNDIRPVVDRTFGLGDLPTALEYFRTARHVGKVTLSW